MPLIQPHGVLALPSRTCPIWARTRAYRRARHALHDWAHNACAPKMVLNASEHVHIGPQYCKVQSSYPTMWFLQVSREASLAPEQLLPQPNRDGSAATVGAPQPEEHASAPADPSAESHQANGTAAGAAAAAGDCSAEGAAENGGPESSAAAEEPEANGHPQQSAEATQPADEILLIPADAGMTNIC